MEIFTIGFTQTTAEDFFGRLKSHRIERLLDVRLFNSSQLAGFAKRDDLAYFLRELVGARYEHAPLLAPSREILDSYKKSKEMSWPEYEEPLPGADARSQRRGRAEPPGIRATHRAALQRGHAGALSSPARGRVSRSALARPGRCASLGGSDAGRRNHRARLLEEMGRTVRRGDLEGKRSLAAAGLGAASRRSFLLTTGVSTDGRSSPLDVVRFEHRGALGDPTQPENVEVADSRWELTDRVEPERCLRRSLSPFGQRAPAPRESRVGRAGNRGTTGC